MDRDMGQKPAQQREPSSELLGPYALLTEIARGEMTTVHLARKHGALGFQRLMAVKRLKPLFARQPECMQLLLDEAKVTAGLHHANVVGVLDVGSEGGCYVVSDYIEGESLEGLLARGAERDPRYLLPVIVDALNGLHAVHTALDDTDQPLHMVHQAPRARHILVGVDGIGRLTDFSQVKARCVEPSRVRSERLRVGYMAPEQALDPERADHRADLFVVGITLWEALTGEKLFDAGDDDRTFQNLLHRRIPRPSEVGLCPPRCFDAVCMRALDRDVAARYASALEMARELRDVALNQALYATPGEIGRWVKSVCRAELSERRRKLGVELSSAEIPITPVRPSPTLEARGASSDALSKGRSSGGTHPVIKRDDGTPLDLDKTPAIGTRGRLSRAPLLRDDEPTARRTLLPRATSDAASLPSGQGRTSTTPYATPVLTGSQSDAAASAPAQPEASASTPAQTSTPRSDRDNTQPSLFVPARPGARRDSNVPSPGAYQQIAPERAERVSQPAGRTTVPLFEDLATRQFQSLPPASRESRPAQRRSPVIQEAPPEHVSRTDSTPTRLTMPEGPVGSPLGSAQLAEAAEKPAEQAQQADTAPQTQQGDTASERQQAGAAPQAQQADPAPQTAADGEAQALAAQAAKTVASAQDAQPLAPRTMLPPSNPVLGGVVTPHPALGSLGAAGASGSLTPPNLAAQTLPPALELDFAPKKRSTGFWIASGVLGAIILLALIVGARQDAQQSPARATAASGPALKAEDEALRPSASRTPAEVSREEQALEGEAAAGAQANDPKRSNASASTPKSTDAAKAKTSARPFEPTPASRKAAPLTTKPAPAKPKSKALHREIPDNPY